MYWRSRDVRIGSVLRCLGLGAGLTERFEECWGMNEGKVGGEVQLEDVELDLGSAKNVMQER